ncbi:MAG: zinc ribbon domain-containing protein [Desulfovibrio sp.]|nr:zinc ribbon domain-containing protein [Desulfovibrio sp.]
MPIYEYQCPKCGNVFEEWVKASEAHKEEPCPKCGTPSPRIMSRTSFVLKGDGWYVSDYGYRKGITEDGGAGASVPAQSTPTTPATQGEKALATTDTAPKAAPKAESGAKAAAKPKKPKAAKADAGAKAKA